MRCFLASLLILLFLACSALGDPVSDANSLRDVAIRNGDLLFASLNGTEILNTSSLITQMSSAIQVANSRLPMPISTSSTANSALDRAYINYLDELHSLADACQRRGRLFHNEMNLPVYEALQSLSTVVHIYGTTLRSRRMIGQASTIRTMTAGSDIIRAQAAWVQNSNYPGKRLVRWRD